MGNTEIRSGKSYREQFERARRFLKRLEHRSRDAIEYQDDMWAFFQNCWYVKDWVKRCKDLSADKKKTIEDLAHASTAIQICRDIANGTKHLLLTDPSVGAVHLHMVTKITPGEGKDIECIMDDGTGARRSGYELAHEAFKAWEGIFDQATVGHLY